MGRYVFGLVIKNKENEQLFLNTFSVAILALKKAMETLGVNKIKMSQIENNILELGWATIELTNKQLLKGSGLSVMVCSGETIFPEKQERDKITKNYHESIAGGHKGVSKTYWAIRKNYYWENIG